AAECDVVELQSVFRLEDVATSVPEALNDLRVKTLAVLRESVLVAGQDLCESSELVHVLPRLGSRPETLAGLALDKEDDLRRWIDVNSVDPLVATAPGQRLGCCPLIVRNVCR